jgi:hypothetical protein
MQDPRREDLLPEPTLPLRNSNNTNSTKTITATITTGMIMAMIKATAHRRRKMSVLGEEDRRQMGISRRTMDMVVALEEVVVRRHRMLEEVQ